MSVQLRVPIFLLVVACTIAVPVAPRFPLWAWLWVLLASAGRVVALADGAADWPVSLRPRLCVPRSHVVPSCDTLFHALRVPAAPTMYLSFVALGALVVELVLFSLHITPYRLLSFPLFPCF